MTSRIEVPKSLLAGLAGVAAVALLGVVFLLGRESGRDTPKEPGKEAAVPVPALPAQSVPGQPVPGQPVPGQTVPGQPVPPQSAQAGPSASPAEPWSPAPPSVSQPIPKAPAIPAGAVPPPATPSRAAVAAYFQAVNALQPQSGGAPEAMAQQVMGSFAQGDTSGFQAMLQQAQETRKRMAAIPVPQPCAAYHQETLACLDAGLDLMLAIQKAISGTPDAQAPDLTNQANALKARSNALQGQEQALKRVFGL